LSTNPATPVLKETARRRADLYAALIAVEHATTRPAPGREEAWAADLIVALGELEAEIEEHIEVTESADGLYHEIAVLAPRLSTKIGQLQADHPAMLERARSLRARVEQASGADGLAVEELRDESRQLLGFLVKHRQRGSDLIWEAYNQDIGGVD